MSEQINILTFITKGKLYFWTVNLFVYLFGRDKIKIKPPAVQNLNLCGINTRYVRKVKNVCAYNPRSCFIVPDQSCGVFSRV